MYKRINSKNYDFLWNVGGQHYLFNSIWLHPGYLSKDFITTGQNDLHTLYISKEQRKIFSHAGLVLLHKRFKPYKDKIIRQLKITQKFFSDIETKNLARLSNEDLAKDFKRTVEYCQKIWGQYFWTEYFCYDRVSQIIQKQDTSFDLGVIKKNVKKMAQLKYRQRKYLNKTAYPDGVLDRYYKVIRKRLSLEANITQYHYKELVDLLLDKRVKIPDRSIYVIGKFSGWRDILGKQAKGIIKQLQSIDPHIKEIKGNIGNKGYYKGRVKNIEFGPETDYAKEINTMKKGEILVSGSTGPEMILACKKAGAIITDEGGITSHAALVSRELNIPCVIGTKIATQVLKDGDLVEVDANKGVVKIIK